jgi:hypothetical protein
MARQELCSALAEARPIAKLFVEYTRNVRAAEDLAEAASELYMKAGRVALFASILAHEFKLEEPKKAPPAAPRPKRPARRRAKRKG